ILAENDPRDFLVGTNDGNEHHEQDEMENEFGGAGNYNQELQTMIQDMMATIMGRQMAAAAAAAAANGEEPTGQQQQQASSADVADGSANDTLLGSTPDGSSAGQAGTFGRGSNTASSDGRRIPGLRTWTSNMGGTQVSFSVGSFSPDALTNRATPSGQRRTGGDGNEASQQQDGGGDDARRPMFIDPEENAPLTLGTLVSSLLGAWGGASRGEDGNGAGGLGQLFGVPIGNLGDYAWGQNSLDDIITNMMDQAPSANSQPPASDESISKLPRRTISDDEAKAKMDCGICMDEYNAAEEVVELPCKHVYHKDCIDHWLKMNGTCPVCRTRIENSDSTKGAGPGSLAARPHSELPGAFPASPSETASAQTHQRDGEREAEPEHEPMD
ncbi:hypothetical protein EV175_003671, partial [Coemansia sp. RSA 1933]